MKIPRAFLKNRLFEIGRTVISGKMGINRKRVEFYRKTISWWITVYGVRFGKVGYYVMLKRLCF